MSESTYCQSCGGILGRDCFNPQECAEITRQQAASYRALPFEDRFIRFLDDMATHLECAGFDECDRDLVSLEQCVANTYGLRMKQAAELRDELNKTIERCQKLADHYERVSGMYPEGDIRGPMMKQAAKDMKQAISPCEYCGGMGSIFVNFEHDQWVRCEACK